MEKKEKFDIDDWVGFTAITSCYSLTATYIDWSMTEYEKWETRSYKTTCTRPVN